MKLEELITSLAYLDYKMSRGAEYSQLVNVYKRNDRISARIMSKDQVTKTLDDVSTSNVQGFLLSINNVDLFARKILTLVNNESNRIRELMNHSRKGTKYKADQNYYYLWLLVKDFSLDYIEKNKEIVFSEIRKIFSIIQKTPQSIEASDFVKKMCDFKTICDNEIFI